MFGRRLVMLLQIDLIGGAKAADVASERFQHGRINLAVLPLVPCILGEDDDFHLNDIAEGDERRRMRQKRHANLPTG
jgi:hypothetical protein